MLLEGLGIKEGEAAIFLVNSMHSIVNNFRQCCAYVGLGRNTKLSSDIQ